MRIQDFQIFRDVNLIQPQRVKLGLEDFVLAVPTWAGASDILAEYPVGNDYWFSFKLPVKTFGINFVLAVRYVEDDIVYRYKFWEGVDEILYYPVYAGEKLGPNAVLEVWSVDSTSAPSLLSTKLLQISVLTFPPNQNCSSCCQNNEIQSILAPSDPSILPPYAYCNPFCDGLCSP